MDLSTVTAAEPAVATVRYRSVNTALFCNAARCFMQHGLAGT
jgi:hypothetical protein